MYLPLGAGRYRATEHTQGPWDPGQQHMGPVTALLVHELTRTPGLPLAKLSVDVFGPVPVDELTVRTALLRDGKRVQCMAATVVAGGRTAVRATGWRIRAEDSRATGARPAPLPIPGPSGASALFDGFGYGRAMDLRFAAGSADELGPATAWGRPTVPLVADEEITPLERLALLADSGNGLSMAIDFAANLFVNVDLTISLFRPPEGEWICLEAATAIGPTGRGLTRGTLYDQHGELGLSAQTLFVGPR